MDSSRLELEEMLGSKPLLPGSSESVGVCGKNARCNLRVPRQRFANALGAAGTTSLALGWEW